MFSFLNKLCGNFLSRSSSLSINESSNYSYNGYTDTAHLPWSNEDKTKKVSNTISDNKLLSIFYVKFNFSKKESLRYSFFEYLKSNHLFFQNTGGEEPKLVSFCEQKLVINNEVESNRFKCYTFESNNWSTELYSNLYVYFVYDYVAVSELLHKMGLDYSLLKSDFILRVGHICVVHYYLNSIYDIQIMTFNSTVASTVASKTDFNVVFYSSQSKTPCDEYISLNDEFLNDLLFISLENTTSYLHTLCFSCDFFLENLILKDSDDINSKVNETEVTGCNNFVQNSTDLTIISSVDDSYTVIKTIQEFLNNLELKKNLDMYTFYQVIEQIEYNDIKIEKNSYVFINKNGGRNFLLNVATKNIKYFN
jgi:hypothetical protein